MGLFDDDKSDFEKQLDAYEEGRKEAREADGGIFEINPHTEGILNPNLVKDMVYGRPEYEDERAAGWEKGYIERKGYQERSKASKSSDSSSSLDYSSSGSSSSNSDNSDLIIPVLVAGFILLTGIIIAIIFSFVSSSNNKGNVGNNGNAGSTAYVNSTILNIRSAPGQESKSLGKLSQGEAVTRYETAQSSDGGTWVKIRSKSLEGWVNEKLLSNTPVNSSQSTVSQSVTSTDNKVNKNNFEQEAVNQNLPNAETATPTPRPRLVRRVTPEQENQLPHSQSPPQQNNTGYNPPVATPAPVKKKPDMLVSRTFYCGKQWVNTGITLNQGNYITIEPESSKLTSFDVSFNRGLDLVTAFGGFHQVMTNGGTLWLRSDFGGNVFIKIMSSYE